MYEQYSTTIPMQKNLEVTTSENPNTKYELAEELKRNSEYNPEYMNTQDQKTDNITEPKPNED